MSDFVLYSIVGNEEDGEERDTILEIWGGSTKHPDVVFRFSNFLLSEWFEPEDQTVPWLLECASRLSIPYNSYRLAKWACDWYEVVRGWKD